MNILNYNICVEYLSMLHQEEIYAQAYGNAHTDIYTP